MEAFLAGSFALQECHRGRVALAVRALDHFEWAILNSPHARALFYMQAMHAALHVEDDAAIARLSDALQRLWPDAFMTRFYAASGLRFLGRMTEAIPALEALARERPDLSATHVTLGAAYATSGRHEDAARAFEEAIAFSPESAIAMRGLGIALRKLGRPDEAVKVLREAVSLATRGAALPRESRGGAVRGRRRRGRASPSTASPCASARRTLGRSGMGSPRG